ncbi:MAG: glycerol-3-phosphate 1-O-acyltransferase PlsY, partial [Phocaeicola sp.]
MILYFISFSILSYLLGSIPSAVWIGKYFYKIDVREHGSGNAGTTNVLRILGSKAALPVFGIDIMKGTMAVLLAYLIPEIQSSPEEFALSKISFGIVSIVGHMYPIFANFRGGKGVATMLGVAVATEPYGAIIAIFIFAFVFMLTRYVSLSSMLAGLSFPVSTFYFIQEASISLRIFS